MKTSKCLKDHLPYFLEISQIPENKQLHNSILFKTYTFRVLSFITIKYSFFNYIFEICEGFVYFDERM